MGKSSITMNYISQAITSKCRTISTMDDLSPEIIEILQSKYMERLIRKLYNPEDSKVYVPRLSEKGLLAQIAMLDIVYDDRIELSRILATIKFAIRCNLNEIAKIALQSVGIQTHSELVENIVYWDEGQALAQFYLPDEFSYKNKPQFIICRNDKEKILISELEKMCGPLERTEKGLYLDTPFVKIRTPKRNI